MKKFAIVFAVIIFVPFLLNAQDCISRFFITSNDSDATVKINDSDFRKLPAEFNLGRGRYSLVVKESQRKWNPQIITDTLEVSACGLDSTIHFNFGKEIILDSHPQNASVISNKNVIGYTPMSFLSTIPAVTLQKKNYESLLIPPGGVRTAETVELKFNGVRNGTDFFESDLFKILLGSAAALGATAAYFKIQADDKYNDYIRSKNPSVLDEVDRLDLYSGIALGLLQVNFGYLIYKFLSD